MTNNKCKIDGCDNKAMTRNWCCTHYNRWWKHGTTNAGVGSGKGKYNQSGWKHTKKSKQLMSKKRKGITANEKNPRWMGNNVSYPALHNWIRKHYPKPNHCEECGIRKSLNKRGHTKLQWANKTKKYLRDKSDWICLCPPCHKKRDLKNKIKHKYHGKT